MKFLSHLLFHIYSLPNAESSELVHNFKQIADKTEEIGKVCNEQIVKTQLQLVAERIKSLIVEIPQMLQTEPIEAEAVIGTPCAIESSQLDASAGNSKANDEIFAD